MVKVKVKNLGPLRQAEFEVGDLTIICGGNNTGKTYATYALYGFLRNWRQWLLAEPDPASLLEILSDGTARIDLRPVAEHAGRHLADSAERYSELLSIVFGTAAPHLRGAQFSCVVEVPSTWPSVALHRRYGSAGRDIFTLSKPSGSETLVASLLTEGPTSDIDATAVELAVAEAMVDAVFGLAFAHPVLMSTERTAAIMFPRELARYLDPGQLQAVTRPFRWPPICQFPLPVSDNIVAAYGLNAAAKASSFLADRHPEVLSHLAALTHGSYASSEHEGLQYHPEESPDLGLSMSECSGAVRSLVLLAFYLSHEAQPGDLLMIDEPELNLHPANQRRMARLLASLVNAGIKVMVTTHSDTIIRELNTLILLSPRTEGLLAIAEQEGYRESEFLDPSRVRAYIAKEAEVVLDGDTEPTRCPTLVPASVSAESGIDIESFDDTIADMNRIQDEIVWGIGRDG